VQRGGWNAAIVSVTRLCRRQGIGPLRAKIFYVRIFSTLEAEIAAQARALAWIGTHCEIGALMFFGTLNAAGRSRYAARWLGPVLAPTSARAFFIDGYKARNSGSPLHMRLWCW
jgi:hypothetical protein